MNFPVFFMAVVLLSVVPLNGLSLWAFAHFRPQQPERLVRAFDTVAYIAVPMLCTVFSFWVHMRLSGSVEQDWLPFFAAIAWPVSFPVLITLAGFLRKLLFVRSARP